MVNLFQIFSDTANEAPLWPQPFCIYNNPETKCTWLSFTVSCREPITYDNSDFVNGIEGGHVCKSIRHSFVHSFVRSFVRSFIHSFSRPCMRDMCACVCHAWVGMAAEEKVRGSWCGGGVVDAYLFLTFRMYLLYDDNDDDRDILCLVGSGDDCAILCSFPLGMEG
jgi:hypothetical protein